MTLALRQPASHLEESLESCTPGIRSRSRSGHQLQLAGEGGCQHGNGNGCFSLLYSDSLKLIAPFPVGSPSLHFQLHSSDMNSSHLFFKNSSCKVSHITLRKKKGGTWVRALTPRNTPVKQGILDAEREEWMESVKAVFLQLLRPYLWLV